jgi:hypothetical protein
MKRPFLVIALLTLGAIALAPIGSAPPVLLSDTNGVHWKCSRSALIVTTCVPNHDGRLVSR